MADSAYKGWRKTGGGIAGVNGRIPDYDLQDLDETCTNCGHKPTRGRCLNCGNCERCDN